jgi:hypothetical protein
MSVSWISANISQLVGLFPKLYALGYCSGDSGKCGTHIHMSQVAFSSLQLYKFMYMVYAHPSLGLLLSQRDAGSLNTYATVIDVRRDYMQRARLKQQCGRNRHDAVNISPKQTVEFRLFNGTLNPLAFMKNIDVALCFYNYANATSVRDLSVKSFMSYLDSNEYTYPYLSLFVHLDQETRDDIFGRDRGPVLPDDCNKAFRCRIKRLYSECTGLSTMPDSDCNASGVTSCGGH